MFEFASQSGLYLVKSPMNYVGGKFKLLNQLMESHSFIVNKKYHGERNSLIPKDVKTFVDIFCGGFNIGANATADHVIGIDLDKDIIDLLRWISSVGSKNGITTIHKIITKYNLGKSQSSSTDTLPENITSEEEDINILNAYDEKQNNIQEKKQNNRSEQQLSPEANAYYDLRELYNRARKANLENLDGFEMPAVLYTLIAHGFSNYIRFSRHGYNIPYGERTFNEDMERNFSEFADRLETESPEFILGNYTNVLELNLNHEDFVYLDPPYLITTATYNENGGWSEEEEHRLYATLDTLNKNKIRFGLSNVIEHKGKTNTILEKWAKKYDVHELKCHYDSASYNSVKNVIPTREVYVTNVKENFSII